MASWSALRVNELNEAKVGKVARYDILFWASNILMEHRSEVVSHKLSEVDDVRVAGEQVWVIVSGLLGGHQGCPHDPQKNARIVGLCSKTIFLWFLMRKRRACDITQIPHAPSMKLAPALLPCSTVKKRNRAPPQGNCKSVPPIA